jgi:hypothetical protein
MSTQVGQRFARAVAARDAESLRILMAPDVDFRALTPSRVWQHGDANAVIDDVILGTWLSAERSVTEIVDVDCAEIGPVCRVGYRFVVRFPDGDHLIEQQAYFKTEGDRISWLHILCSGFVRDD